MLGIVHDLQHAYNSYSFTNIHLPCTTIIELCEAHASDHTTQTFITTCVNIATHINKKATYFYQGNDNKCSSLLDQWLREATSKYHMDTNKPSTLATQELPNFKVHVEKWLNGMPEL